MNMIKAYGVIRVKSKPFRREFKSMDALYAWAERRDAEVHGVRETFEAMDVRVKAEVQAGVED